MGDDLFKQVEESTKHNKNTKTTEAAAPTTDQVEAEIKLLELAAKRLELKEREANLQDIEERLSERMLKRENHRQKAITNGQTIKILNAEKATQQKRCNHRKGGNGAAGVVGGQGNNEQYAVLKHQFVNGDVWISCLRCHKTWKPPLKDSYTQQYPTAKNYEEALTEYERAKNFNTLNSPSSGVIMQFSDGGEHYRQVTKDVTL